MRFRAAAALEAGLLDATDTNVSAADADADGSSQAMNLEARECVSQRLAMQRSENSRSDAPSNESGRNKQFVRTLQFFCALAGC